MSYPQSATEILTELDSIETKIQTLLASPEAFAKLTAGSITIDPAQYMNALEKRRSMLQAQLDTIPYWIGSDPTQGGIF